MRCISDKFVPIYKRAHTVRIYIFGFISHELYGPFINQITSSISVSRDSIPGYYCCYQIMNSFCEHATLSDHGLAEKLP